MRIDGGVPMLRQTLASVLADVAGTAAAFRADGEAGGVAAPAQVAATPSVATSVQMLVALAAIDPVADRRRRDAVQADKGLTLLERLRDAMAAGRVSPGDIAEMRAWAEGFAAPEDPVLGPIARDIELRVRVELARYDVSV